MQPEEVITSWKKIGPAVREGLLVGCALLVAIVLPFLWAVFLRKRRRRRHHYHYPQNHSPAPAEEIMPNGTDDVSTKRRKWRRRRRDHRPRNPTLAETGGLPPVRPEGTPPPPP